MGRGKGVFFEEKSGVRWKLSRGAGSVGKESVCVCCVCVGVILHVGSFILSIPVSILFW